LSGKTLYEQIAYRIWYAVAEYYYIQCNCSP